MRMEGKAGRAPFMRPLFTIVSTAPLSTANLHFCFEIDPLTYQETRGNMGGVVAEVLAGVVAGDM